MKRLVELNCSSSATLATEICGRQNIAFQNNAIRTMTDGLARSVKLKNKRGSKYHICRLPHSRHKACGWLARFCRLALVRTSHQFSYVRCCRLATQRIPPYQYSSGLARSVLWYCLGDINTQGLQHSGPEICGRQSIGGADLRSRRLRTSSLMSGAVVLRHNAFRIISLEDINTHSQLYLQRDCKSSFIYLVFGALLNQLKSEQKLEKTQVRIQ